MKDSMRICLVFLLLGLTVDFGYSKTVSSNEGTEDALEPCEGDICPPRDENLNSALQGPGGGSQSSVGAEEGTVDINNSVEGHQDPIQRNEESQQQRQQSEEYPGQIQGQQEPDAERATADDSSEQTGVSHEKIQSVEDTADDSAQPEVRGEAEHGQDPHAGRRSDIDPEAMLHPNGEVHHSQEAEVNPDEGHKYEPDAEKELHGGHDDVHSNPSSSQEDPVSTESGPDLDAVLHGGDRHVHSSENTRESSDQNAHGQFGVDPEGVLHDGAHVHTPKDPTDEANQGHDYATDIESVLHGGDRHVHSHEAKRTDEDKIGVVPIGATDPEALIHGGDGHVHSRGARFAGRTDPDPRPYGAQDPESVLHGTDDHDHRIQQAMDGSRPLPSTKDPDHSTMDVNPEEVKIGTLRPEDSEDYFQWKEEKGQQAEARESSSSAWFPGFSYLKDTIWKDLQAVKERYLARFWSDDEVVKTTGDEDQTAPRTPHDEP